MPTHTEEQLRQALEDADKELRQARNKVSTLKKALTDAESEMIEAKLLRDRLIEKMRVWRNENIDDLETTDREEDIARFREVLPELLKKVK